MNAHLLWFNFLLALASGKLEVFDTLPSDDLCDDSTSSCSLDLRQLRSGKQSNLDVSKSDGDSSQHASEHHVRQQRQRGGAGEQQGETPKRLIIRNGCDQETMWIAHIATDKPGPDPQDVRLEPGQEFAFQTPDNLRATRYWPKIGCDDQGGSCFIGESGGPKESCNHGGDNYTNCAPPVDSKFEATFGENGQPCDPNVEGGRGMRGCDFVDMSLVDGFTLPFTFTLNGKCEEGWTEKTIDCRGLTLDRCPSAEVLKDFNLKVTETLDLRAHRSNESRIQGCYSPCMKLRDDKWTDQEERSPTDSVIRPYCCPEGVEPDECRRGPINDAAYFKLLQSTCSGSYSYAYDDNKLLRCDSTTVYTVTFFCPTRVPVS